MRYNTAFFFDELEALDKEERNDQVEKNEIIKPRTKYGQTKGLILRDKNHTFMRTVIFDSYPDMQIDTNDIDPLIKMDNSIKDNVDNDSGIEDIMLHQTATEYWWCQVRHVVQYNKRQNHVGSLT